MYKYVITAQQYHIPSTVLRTVQITQGKRTDRGMSARGRSGAGHIKNQGKYFLFLVIYYLLFIIYYLLFVVFLHFRKYTVQYCTVCWGARNSVVHFSERERKRSKLSAAVLQRSTCTCLRSRVRYSTMPYRTLGIPSSWRLLASILPSPSFRTFIRSNSAVNGLFFLKTHVLEREEVSTVHHAGRR